jgi:hypothetical protein
MLIQLWPIASTNDFVDMPMGGWFFLLLGWALAEARWGGANPPIFEQVPSDWNRSLQKKKYYHKDTETRRTVSAAARQTLLPASVSLW